MKKELQGFVNERGYNYNIRNINYDSKEEAGLNFGIFRCETVHSCSFAMSSTFDARKGVYIYETKDNSNVALRIYKDYRDYPYICYSDHKLIEKLQKKQSLIKLTTFPTGIVSIKNSVIGQEIPFYGNYDTLLKAFLDNTIEDPKAIYLKIVEILLELCNNGVLYCDNHAKNFMIDKSRSDIKLIDFEDSFISFDDSGNTAYLSLLNNLKRMLIKLNEIYSITFDESFDKTTTLEEIQEFVYGQNKLKRVLTNKKK